MTNYEHLPLQIWNGSSEQAWKQSAPRNNEGEVYARAGFTGVLGVEAERAGGGGSPAVRPLHC